MVLLSIPEDKHREGAHASGAIREDQSIGERLAALRVQSLKARAKNAGAIHSGASPRTTRESVGSASEFSETGSDPPLHTERAIAPTTPKTPVASPAAPSSDYWRAELKPDVALPFYYEALDAALDAVAAELPGQRVS